MVDLAIHTVTAVRFNAVEVKAGEPDSFHTIRIYLTDHLGVVHEIVGYGDKTPIPITFGAA